MNRDDEFPRDAHGGGTVPPWLAALRTDLSTRSAPAWVESRLLTAAAEQRTLQALAAPAITRPAPRPTPWWRRRWLVPALAGCLSLTVALALLSVPTAGIAPAVAAPAAPFIALAPIDAIAAETASQIVPAQLPRAALAGFGLPIDPARADVPVQTELLMSPRGVVLAVRFLETQ